MKIWWILGGLFLLSRRPAAVTVKPGGMTPAESAGDAVGTAIDAVSGQQVNVIGPLPTTVVGQIGSSTSFAIDASDEAFLAMPALDASATAGISGLMTPGPQLLQNPDTLPNAWPGLAAAAPAPAATPSRFGGGTMLFDLTQDSFLVPGFGDESFSPNTLTPDQKLAVLRSQGYTGPDPRQVATTSLGTALDANPPINPTTERVALPNV